jgi:DNA-binding transcriptional LysR family regulator
LTFHYENSMAEALKPFAIAGAGLAWLPEICIRRELDTGALVHAGEEEHVKSISIRLYRSVESSRAEVERLWAFASSCVDGA